MSSGSDVRRQGLLHQVRDGRVYPGGYAPRSFTSLVERRNGWDHEALKAYLEDRDQAVDRKLGLGRFAYSRGPAVRVETGYDPIDDG